MFKNKRICARYKVAWRSAKHLLLSCLAILMCAGSAMASPNIVVIIADDLSKDAFDTLVQGGWLPNIQQYLISSGVRFENAFVTNSQCCPSRATLLTGQYSHNHGVFSNQSPDPLQGGIAWPGWLPKDGKPGRNESTVATWLQAAGYHTGFVGKYLNGYGNVAPDTVSDPQTYIPPGWSVWNGLIDPTTYRVYDYLINQNGTPVYYGTTEAEYQTDVLTGLAIDFIQQSVTGQEPFFLTVTPLAPHLEVINIMDILTGNEPRDGFGLTIRPAPRHAHLIDGNNANGEMPGLQIKPSFNEADLSDKPSCPAPLPPVEPAVVADPYCVADRLEIRADLDIPNLERQYKSMLASMLSVDDMVGTIVNELETTGVLPNTVIIFMSDNGWFYGEHRLLGKELAYEESIRIPLAIRAPGAHAGATAQQIILNNDIAPTIAELAGVAPPYDPDGQGISSLLVDPVNASWFRKSFLVERWFVPSLIKFESPTLFAWRKKNGNSDFVYIATHADKDNPGTPTHHEFYDLRADQYQVNSIPLSDAIIQGSQSFLLQMRLCKGARCREVEAL